jgi:hypothetical protein
MTMRPLFYILDANHNPTPVDDPLEWVNFRAKNKIHVAKTKIRKIVVSTVFLGVDQNWFPEGPPVSVWMTELKERNLWTETENPIAERWGGGEPKLIVVDIPCETIELPDEKDSESDAG